MSAQIDIITTGYAYPFHPEGQGPGGEDKFMKASGSSCLVRSGGLRILFDTMGPWERDLLLEKIARLNIHPDDIDYLVCSHSHADHVGNINLFTKAKKHFIGTLVYSQDIYDLTHFEPNGSYEYETKRGVKVDVLQFKEHSFDKNLRVEPTKGHTMECVSLIVENCDKYGRVGLVGDLFEREEDLDDETIWLLAGSQDPDLQRASRARVYHKVDYILPGHGPLFKIDKTRNIRF